VVWPCSKPGKPAGSRKAVDLAHTLGLRVVGEGVEDAGALGLVSDWICDKAQGNYICRPIQAGELLSWLSAGLPGFRRG
jgi:diguanylate cyclase